MDGSEIVRGTCSFGTAECEIDKFGEWHVDACPAWEHRSRIQRGLCWAWMLECANRWRTRQANKYSSDVLAGAAADLGLVPSYEPDYHAAYDREAQREHRNKANHIFPVRS